jgi:hypothetical protein
VGLDIGSGEGAHDQRQSPLGHLAAQGRQALGGLGRQPIRAYRNSQETRHPAAA